VCVLVGVPIKRLCEVHGATIKKIQQILINNKYDSLTASRLNNKKKQKKQEKDIQKVKWAKFTYVGNETRLITKLFKHTSLKIAFTTDNTIDRLLST